jgi:hypothetical protein
MSALSAHIMALIPKVKFSKNVTMHRVITPVFQYRRVELFTNKLRSSAQQIKQEIGNSG